MTISARNLLLTFSSTFATLLAVEATTQFLLREDAFLSSWQERYWLVRHTPETCNQKLHAQSDIVKDERLGWKSKPNFSANGINHDADGFRSSASSASKPAGRSIVSIGDSFTYGLGMPDGYTYSDQLSRLLKKPVINMGVNSYGVDQALLRWEQEKQNHRPSHVILGFYADDFHRNALRIRDVGAKPYFAVSATQALVLNGRPQCDAMVSKFRWNSRLVDASDSLIRKVSDRLGIYPMDVLQDRRRLNQRILKRLQSSVTEAGADLIVLLIPHCAHPNDGSYGDWILERTKEDCQALGAACLDFRDLVRPGMYGENCHWSRLGNQTVAERIASHISGRALK